jgi:nicotinamidase-related amidase
MGCSSSKASQPVSSDGTLLAKQHAKVTRPIQSPIVYASLTQHLQRKDTPLFYEYLEHLEAAGAGNIVSVKKQLGPDDALLVIDMQNDFIPSTDPKSGGRFAVAEGNLVAPLCAQLVAATMAAGGDVVATRDYHPVDHCSFSTEGGHFPPHCVQGTTGSKFCPAVAAAMSSAIKRDKNRASIAFKGFHEDIDSFGALPYANGGEGRITRRGKLCADAFSGCNAAPWTGCLLCKCSSLHFDGEVDVDAAPDMLAVHHGAPRGVEDMVTRLKKCGAKRLLVCGLALDFCVCDTALNARDYGFEEVVIVLDATRAAHIPGVGAFGSGFLSDPVDFVAKLQTAGITFTSTLALTCDRLPLPPPVPPAVSEGSFPETLKPFGLEPAQDLDIAMCPGWTSFEVTFQGQMQVLNGRLGQGRCTPFSGVTLPREARSALNIPQAAQTFCFAYPLVGMDRLSSDLRSVFLSAHQDANWRFICYGGFLYFSADGDVLAANAVGSGTDLVFGAAQSWRTEYTSKLVSQKRFQPVTLTDLLAVGARHFSWIHAGETLVSSSGSWEPATHGGFVYLFGEDVTAPSSRDIFFPVSEASRAVPAN